MAVIDMYVCMDSFIGNLFNPCWQYLTVLCPLVQELETFFCSTLHSPWQLHSLLMDGGVSAWKHG